MTIAYTITNEGDIAVRLDGRKVGEIRMLPNGFKYYPRGAKTGGESFPSLEACKSSLEDETHE
jgi:hypothetical protein